MHTRPLLMMLTISALVGAALVWAFLPAPASVEVSTARLGVFEQSVDEEGRTQLRARYRVTAPLSGTLTRMPWREGDAIRTGTVLASLQPPPPALRDVRTERELQAREAAAQASLQRSRSRLERAQIAVRQAQAVITRNAPLAEQGYLSASQHDADHWALASARQDQITAEHEQRQASYDLRQAQAARNSFATLRQRPHTLSIPIIAPTEGRILKVLQSSEGVITAGTPLLELGDTRHLEVVTELLTTDAVRVRPGHVVHLTGWGQDTPLRGQVRAIDPAAFTKVSALGVEEQRVNVRIDLDPLPESAQMLGDGFRVDVRIMVLQQAGALLIPAGAVFAHPHPPADRAPPSWAVLVLESGRAQLRTVQLGGRYAGQAWITDGLRPAEQVIVYPPATLRTGERVRVRPTAQSAGIGLG